MPVKVVGQEDNKLTIEIDNGDLEKLNQCLESWNFKDHQSLLRFSMSVLLLAENQDLWIRTDNDVEKIIPAKDYLKDSGGE